MKLEDAFQSFLENEVNLNDGRHKRMKEGAEVIENFLRDSEDFKDIIIDVIPQGSFRQKTIIKPVQDGQDYDIDLLLELKEISGKEPRDYLNMLHKVFKDHGTYEDITDRSGKTRCITINYADDFHIDIVPAISRQGQYFIMNKNTNEFEPTDADGYAGWFAGQNSITGNGRLVEVVRLIKYIRDKKQTFSAKSVILTTLIGKCVSPSDTADYYIDTPTALKTLSSRLADYLSVNPDLPKVTNPVLPAEEFIRHWDEEKYSNFREKILYYNGKIQAAYDSQNEEESYKLWTEVFGDDFPKYEGDIAKSALATGPFVSPRTPTGDIAPRKYG